MKKFIATNISYIYQYFDKNKSLLETFSFLMVAQSFIYSSDLKDVGVQSVNAFKIVLWIMIFFVIILLQVSTAVELYKENGVISGRILEGANFMKVIMRLLTLVLLIAAVPIFIKQIQISMHNNLFSVFYVSLAVVGIFELTAFLVAHMLPKSLTRHHSE